MIDPTAEYFAEECWQKAIDAMGEPERPSYIECSHEVYFEMYMLGSGPQIYN